jgi:hypothetical protein
MADALRREWLEPIKDPWDLIPPERRAALRRDLAEMAKRRDEAMFNARFARLP